MNKHQLHNELKQKNKEKNKKKYCKLAVAALPTFFLSIPRQLTAEITLVVNCRISHASLGS